jgi:hypothetical protein
MKLLLFLLFIIIAYILSPQYTNILYTIRMITGDS